MKILYVGSRDNNHSAFGGYDKITDMPGSDWLSNKDALFGFSKNRILIRLNSLLLDLKVRFLAKNYDIVHFFYGDAFVRFPYYSKKTKFITTIHLDFNHKKWNQKGFEKSVKSMSGVIVLSRQQQNDLVKYHGINSYFIPHGFDKPEYIKIKQSTMDIRKINIVFIGRNYRDIKTFDYIIKKNYDNIIFHCIGQNKEFKEKYKTQKNVIIYDRLDDNNYYSLIEQCDYNFLPLTYATANNALLEAQYLNVKSILPKISGISDYAESNTENIFYENLTDLDNIFQNLKKYEKNNNLNNFSQKYSWINVYKLLIEYYGNLK